MRAKRASLIAAAAGAVGLIGSYTAPAAEPRAGPSSVDYARDGFAEDATRGWSDLSALAARRLLDAYGYPDEIHYGRLVWLGRGPWKRITARDLRPVGESTADLGLIEQTLDWRMTPEQAAQVAVFDPRLTYDARAGELSVRTDREETNFLLMNLANDVVLRRLSARQARDSAVSLLTLEASGKKTPYLLSLHFLPPLP